MSATGRAPPAAPAGFRLLPGFLDPDEQRTLVDTILRAIGPQGWISPAMPRSGRPFSVQIANLGPLGWIADRDGYRYQPTHPGTGRPWPPMPEPILAVWREIAGFPHPPECCLVNRYRAGARLGLHRDEDEAELAAPVVSVSLGDTALFRLGGLARRDPTRSLRLHSGDVVVLGGDARLAFHGIDRILAGSSALVPGGGRINLTMRRVTRARP